MAKILFIIPRCQGRFGTPSTPHVGISYLAAYVRRNSHEPKIIDRRVECFRIRDVKSEIEKFKPDFIGITSVSLEYRKTYEFINLLTSWGMRVIYGGPHVSLVREAVYQSCTPYAAVYGEGEEKLCEILDGKPLSSIQGIIYQDASGKIVVTPPRKGITDLDTLPFPAYELSRMRLYAERKIPLTTSRDCPYDCTYCNVKLIMGRGFRKRSAENVVAEIEQWHKAGYDHFGINDDTFTSDIARAEKICDCIVERGIKIRWELRTGIRIDRVNERLLGKMKAAGCEFLAYGIESIDDDILRAVKKGITFSQIRAVVSMTEKVGIPFSGFFIIGLPGDTFDKFQKLLAFAQSHSFAEVRFYNLEPYPFTEVYAWVRDNGTLFQPPEVYLNESSRLQSDPLFETPQFTRPERQKAYNLGETLMVQLLIKKTFGNTIGTILAPVFSINFLRASTLTIGFRFSSLARKLQKMMERRQSRK